MMRNDEEIKGVYQHDENREEQREPADFRKKRRAIFHEAFIMDEEPQVISSTLAFEGRVFSVTRERLRFADGAEHRVDVVKHAASYAVVATTPEGRIVLVRQYRHPVAASLWEIPAGSAEEGESVADGARRELAEETGYRAASVRLLGAFATSPGFCSEIMHFVHAFDLSPGEQSLDQDERITVASFTLDEAQSLMETGQIADMKTAFTIVWMRANGGELVPGRADN